MTHSYSQAFITPIMTQCFNEDLVVLPNDENVADTRLRAQSECDPVNSFYALVL